VVSDDDELYFLDQEYAGLNDDELKEMLECYLNLLEIPHPERNPLNYAHIREQQQQDDKLLALQTKYPVTRRIPLKTIGRLPCRTRWWMTRSSDFTKAWDILEKKG
jgi:hypothetical protein